MELLLLLLLLFLFTNYKTHNKDILTTNDSLFIIKCYGSFQDSTFVYLALEYVPGGELHRLIYHRKAFSLDMSIFYAAGETCLSVVVVCLLRDKCCIVSSVQVLNK